MVNRSKTRSLWLDAFAADVIATLEVEAKADRA